MFQKVKIFSDSCRYGIFQIFIIVLESNEEMYVVRIKLYGVHTWFTIINNHTTVQPRFTFLWSTFLHKVFSYPSSITYKLNPKRL